MEIEKAEDIILFRFILKHMSQLVANVTIGKGSIMHIMGFMIYVRRVLVKTPEQRQRMRHLFFIALQRLWTHADPEGYERYSKTILSVLDCPKSLNDGHKQLMGAHHNELQALRHDFRKCEC